MTIFSSILLAAAAVAEPIGNLSDLLDACEDLSNVGRCFDIEANVLSYTRRPVKHEWSFVIADGDRRLTVYEWNEPGLPATNLSSVALNDRLRLQGVVYAYNGHAYAGYKNLARLRACPLPADRFACPQDLFRPDNLNRLLRLRGCVRDAFRDEGDSNYIYMTVVCDGRPLHVMVAHLAEFPFNPNDYIGAEVVVSGLCSETDDCLRRQIRRVLIVSGPENIETVRPPESDLSRIPSLDDLRPLPPADFASLGRHQTVGTVLAVWNGDNVLVRDRRGEPVKAQLQHGPLPSYGATVRLVGLPETDLYFVNLVHATWEPVTAPTVRPETPVDITPATILTSASGDPQIKVKSHGRAIRLTGVVRHLPAADAPDTRILIESGGYLVPVDIGPDTRLPDRLSVGSTIAVSGTCVIDIGSPYVGSTSPRATGFFLVVRTPEDLRVLAAPPWWSPGRLLTLLGFFAAALIGVVVWNIALRRRAERRGRELAAEQLAHVTSELKVNERTRLAVELHDALSQTLTGVSMQIDTAAGLVQDRLPTVSKCLALASRTIDACRMELRNTLWDLRSAALDEPDMNAAIRKSLCQNLANVDLSVRFNVPREAFSDNTAHAVLKIVRELAANALRHGRATALKIAGAVENGRLMFSVRDNGCGFDPDRAPGIVQGHFGLQGIGERLDRINGEMTIDSAPGRGTKVTVVLPIPRSGGLTIRAVPVL